jgi:hypothetical protein
MRHEGGGNRFGHGKVLYRDRHGIIPLAAIPPLR